MSLEHSQIGGVYPVRKVVLRKPCRYADADAVVEGLLRQLEEHPNVHLIAVFDQLELMWESGGNIPNDLQALVNVIFSFGDRTSDELIPLGPRTIVVTELVDQFAIYFMESPVLEFNDIVSGWLAHLSQDNI